MVNKQKVLNLYKEIGETPLETIERFKLENPEYKKDKMTYVGRLDPMAEGELMILVGEECKKKDDYLGKDKEYEFEILFGFKTDSYDVLGIPEVYGINKDMIKEKFANVIESFKGKHMQKYPPYSSKTVDGVQLHELTNSGKKVDLPEHLIEIYNIEFLEFKNISGKELLDNLENRISLVTGNFRQKIIIKKWQDILGDFEDKNFLVAKAKMNCSTGTYVRTLVNDLPFPATTFGIKRTKIY